MARASRLQWRVALLLAALPAAGGCVGLSIPLGELRAGAPAVTGSIDAAWALPSSLPDGLAASDAAAMADAARRALAGGGRQADAEWQNAATGSSGTLAALGEAERQGEELCRSYVSTVTSIRGVHRYTSRACRAGEGRVTIRSIEAAGIETASAAGI